LETFHPHSLPTVDFSISKTAQITAPTQHYRELKQTTTTTATRTSPNKRFNEQNNSCARALQDFVHFFAVLCKTRTINGQVLRRLWKANDSG